MSGEEMEKLVDSVHYYVTDNFPLAKMSDEELEEQINQVVTQTSLLRKRDVCSDWIRNLRASGVWRMWFRRSWVWQAVRSTRRIQL